MEHDRRYAHSDTDAQAATRLEVVLALVGVGLKTSSFHLSQVTESRLEQSPPSHARALFSVMHVIEEVKDDAHPLKVHPEVMHEVRDQPLLPDPHI